MIAWIVSTFGQLAVNFALGIIKEYQGRKDVSDIARLEVANAVLELSAEASKVKARLAASPDGGGTLSVLPDAGSVPLPGGDASPKGKAS
jgi:hypothetical protein